MHWPDSGLSPLRLESLGLACTLFLATVFLNPAPPSLLSTTSVMQDTTIREPDYRLGNSRVHSFDFCSCCACVCACMCVRACDWDGWGTGVGMTACLWVSWSSSHLDGTDQGSVLSYCADGTTLVPRGFRFLTFVDFSIICILRKHTRGPFSFLFLCAQKFRVFFSPLVNNRKTLKRYW